MPLVKRPCGFFRIHERHSFLCSEPSGYHNHSCAGFPLLYVPEAETVFWHSPPRCPAVGIALFDHEHFWASQGAEKETDSRRKARRYWPMTDFRIDSPCSRFNLSWRFHHSRPMKIVLSFLKLCCACPNLLSCCWQKIWGCRFWWFHLDLPPIWW